MKKLFSIVIIIFVVLISYRNADYITRCVVLRSTTFSKTIEVKEMTVDSVNEDITSLKDKNGDIFTIIDDRFHQGDFVEVGIDSMGTVDPKDDAIVWTIKK